MKKFTTATFAAVGLAVAISSFGASTEPVSAGVRADCDAYAARHADRRAGRSTRRGALGGAAAGGLVGALVSKKHRGRNALIGGLIGGGAGAVGGSRRGDRRWQQRYNSAFNDCMYRRRNVAPVRYAAPPRWTAEWYDYCAAKYRSFNPNTGYYTTFSGYKKLCQ